MSPNADNAMARFLFAILKQKNLKDIDWNQVAQDPVLMQPITNGHAARMRYSRFRSTILGNESHKRRSSTDKSKVTKSSKKDHRVKSESITKSESGMSLASFGQLSSGSVSPCMEDDMDTRFLTPCSDDLSQPLSIRPSVVDGYGIDYSAPGFLKQEPGLDGSPDWSAFDAAYGLDSYNAFELQSQSLLDGAPSILDGSDWSQAFPENNF